MSVLNPFQFKQTEPSMRWIVNHNIGNYPIVDVMVYEGGVLTKIIPKDIKIVDMNTCEIFFSSARTGEARLV